MPRFRSIGQLRFQTLAARRLNISIIFVWVIAIALAIMPDVARCQDVNTAEQPQTTKDQSNERLAEIPDSPSANATINAKPAVSEPAAATANTITNPKSNAKRRYQHKKYNNLVYSRGEDYRLLCDVYKPDGKGPFPAVIAIHGGAWRHGSKFQMLRHAWKLASAGYVVIAINYRLSPEHKFPAQVYDCKQAVRWTRYKAEKLNVDPEKIAVFGYSAGGHLGAMLGTTDTEDGLEGGPIEQFKEYSSRVQCVVIGGAPCEFDWIKSDALVDWLGQSPGDAPELYKKAAPVSYVSSDDPPFIFFHGSKDMVVPPRSSRALYERLKKQQIDCRYHTIEGKGHFATFSDTTWLDDAIEFMDDKLARIHHE